MQQFKVSECGLSLLICDEDVLFLLIYLVTLLVEVTEQETIDDPVLIALRPDELAEARPNPQAQLNLILDVRSGS